MSFIPPMDLGFTPSTREAGRFGSPPLPSPTRRRPLLALRSWLAACLSRA